MSDLEKLETQALLLLAQQGNAEACGIFCKRVLAFTYNYMRKKYPKRDAEEMAQHVVLVWLLRIKNRLPVDDWRAFTARVIRNRVINEADSAHERRSVEMSRLDTEYGAFAERIAEHFFGTPPEQLARQEMLRQLKEAIESLSDRSRQFILVELEGLADPLIAKSDVNQAIADRLGTSVENVFVRRYRAYAELGKVLALRWKDHENPGELPPGGVA